MAQVLFCGSCGTRWQNGRFCGNCGAPQLLLPPAGPPPATAKQDNSQNPHIPNYFQSPCVPILKDCQGKDTWLPSEFALCYLKNVKTSYRREEEKKRVFFITSLGRIGIVKETSGSTISSALPMALKGKFSASDHVASIRELKIEPASSSTATLTMVLRGREFVLKGASLAEVASVVTAVNTVSFILYGGKPPFKTTNAKNINVELKSHQIVIPSAEFIIPNNLPPGWEQGFCWHQHTFCRYYINKVAGSTYWELPPDAQEQCNVLKLRNYPRCLPDHGLWAAIQLWTFFFTFHGYRPPLSGETDPSKLLEQATIEAPPRCKGSSEVVLRAQIWQPYWCAKGATNAHNGRVSTVVDVAILMLTLTKPGAKNLTDNWYDGAFFPALQIALGNNKFFTGITLSGGAGDTLLQPLVSRSGLLHMLRAAAPSLVELHMPLIPKLSMGGGMPLIPPPQPTLGVQVWSGQHMPKKDFFGKIDTFAEVYLVDQAAGAASVKKGKAEHKTKPVMSNYHPDWHDPQLLGSVEWFTMRVPGPSSNSKLLGLVEDYNTVKSSDLVGHFEAPLPPTGGMKEGWYAVKDEKERDVKGHDKHFAQMYVKAKWMDEQSIQQGIRVPQMPDGKLTSIDLSWRTDLAPNVLQYVLHHAGVLKTLKLAGISCNKDRIYAEQQGSPSEMAVVAQAIHLATHWPGAPLPRGWQQGVHYTLGTSVFRPTQMVVAPGGIFAKVTGRVEGSKDYYIDNGTGQIGSVPAAQLGVISPLCKGWAQSLRVLDVSCNKGWSEQWQDSFGWAVARMSVLEELHMESVPIVTVLRQMQHLSASGCALPPIKVLNVAASHGLRTEEESELLAMVLGGLRDSLGKPGAVLRTTNCFVNLQSFDSALKALAGLGMARDADLELSVPSCNEAQLEQVLAGTSFRGAINTNHMPASIAAAVLRGLAVNTCVSKLNCSSLYHAQPPPLVDQRVRDALRAFLAGNTSIKSLDLSHNPLVPSLPAFLPRWAYRDKQAFSPQLDTEYKYAESPAGNGWHRIRDAIVKQKWELKPHVSQILAEASQHPAWALGALAENKSITKLSLEGCDLGDAGLTSLGQALRANRTLTSLNFDCNRFSLDGLKGFKGCLYGNKKIVVDPPTGEAAMLIGDLQKNISRQEEIVVQSKQQIKIACRGGRVKPWLGNPALKKKALSELVEAKREQGRSSRLMKKIEAEMKWIWDKMDGNARLAVEKQLAKEEAKEEAEYQKELQKQAKMHSKLQGALGALSKFQEKTGKQKKDKGWKKTKDKRHDRDHYDDHHHHYSSDSSWSSFWSSDSDYDYCMENEQFVAADMNANDLAVMHAAEETEAQAEAAAAAEEAADLAEVEAYAGAGPRDLWKGGGGTDGEAARVLAGARARRAARRQACAVRCANAMRHEEAMRERAAWMQNEEDVIHGTVACKYRTAAAFLKALEDAGSQQVTLVTQSSLDRLPRLAAQVVAYGNAPVSVALFVPSLVADESGESGGDAVDGEARMLDSIRQFHAQLAAKGVRKMTISLLFGNSPCEREYDNMYPINNLRNLALDAATTEMVLLVDVDFVPSPQLALVCGGGSRDSKRQPPPAISFADVQSFCCNGAVLVVPAFEVGTESELAVLPSTQDELASLWHERRAEGFHVSNFPKGHSPTDFERWFNASLPYAVTYQENFEPYIIARRVGLPRYDERFRGYGMNKISYLYEIAAAGKQFVVLPQVFLTAREHERSHSYERVFGDNRDPGHAVRIALLWGSFKRQVQAKYLTAVTTSDKPAAEEALHKLKPVAPPPPPAYAREPGQDMEERHEDEIAKAKPECKWLFYPSKGRRPVRIAGNKCRKTQGARRMLHDPAACL